MLPLILVALLRAEPPLVFDQDGQFIVIDREAKVVDRLTRVCGLKPVELAMSPDLSTYVFTAWEERIENWLLYACPRGGAEPRLLGEKTGYHGHPAFTADGDWVYFSHHPRKGGPPGQHEPGANAQLYRVHLDGTGLEWK